MGWGSPVALSSGKLVLPVTMDVFLFHSLNDYPSTNSEAHKYRELVCFSTTRYHQTQHSTDCPWVVPWPVWKIKMSVRMWKPDKIPASQSLLPVIGAHDKQNVSRTYIEASRAKNHVETISKWVPETRRLKVDLLLREDSILAEWQKWMLLRKVQDSGRMNLKEPTRGGLGTEES